MSVSKSVKRSLLLLAFSSKQFLLAVLIAIFSLFPYTQYIFESVSFGTYEIPTAVATTVTYDFESDTIGAAPTDITGVNGTSQVLAGQKMEILTASSGSAAIRSGVILRGVGSNSQATGSKQGYLFQTNPVFGHTRIYTSNPTAFTQINQTTLAAPGAGVDRWYKATVNGSTLTFEYSDNGTTFTELVELTNTAC